MDLEPTALSSTSMSGDIQDVEVSVRVLKTDIGVGVVLQDQEVKKAVDRARKVSTGRGRGPKEAAESCPFNTPAGVLDARRCGVSRNCPKRVKCI